MYKIEYKTKNGVLSFESESPDAIKRFIDWISKRKDLSEKEEKTTSKTKTDRGQSRLKIYDQLVKFIEDAKKQYGDEIDKLIKTNDIQVNEKMTAQQVRRAFAILRKFLREKSSKKVENDEDIPF